MDQELYGQIGQTSLGASAEGVPGRFRISRRGALFTASWKQQLLMAGRCFRVNIGTVTGGGNIAGITGGGAGTTIDQNQPELVISIASADLVLIPLEISVSVSAPGNKADDAIAAIFTADTAAATAAVAGTNSTALTPANLLDGHTYSPTTVTAEAVTADITNPTVSRILCSAQGVTVAMEATETGAAFAHLNLLWTPEAPDILKGPCAIYGYAGGTAAVTVVGSVVYAVVAASEFAE